jgi:hypothetical protein
LKLRASSASVSVKLAMEFTVLTAARTSEVLEAEWKEFDIDARLMPWAFWRACSTV